MKTNPEAKQESKGELKAKRDSQAKDSQAKRISGGSLLAYGALTLALAGGAIVGIRSFGAEPTAKQAIETATTAPHAQSAERAGGSRLQSPFPVTAFELEFTFKGTQQGNDFMGLALNGNLELEDVSGEVHVPAEGAGAANPAELKVMHGRFRGEVDVTQAGKSVPEQTQDEVLSGASRDFFAVYEPSGQLHSMRFALGVSRLSQTMLRGVLTTAQFVQPATARGAQRWDVEETDSNGRYEARYSRPNTQTVNAGQAQPTQKAKLRYVASFGGATHQILKSQGSFTREGDKTTEADVLERILVKSTVGITDAIEGETHLVLHATKSQGLLMAVSAEQLEGLFKSYERLGLDDAGTESSKQHEIDVAMVAGQTLESALITLRKPAAKDEAGKHEQSNAFRRLTALLRLDPKLVGDLMKWVKEGDPLSSTFIAALRDAGTKEAQTALTGLFRETSLSDNTRAELVRGLSLTANPTSESTELLRELSKGDSPFAEQAVFGLGSHARRAELAGNDNGAIMGELVGGLEGSKNAQTRARYLTALGNAGDHDSLPALRKSIEEGPATSRADAVHALRRIVGDDVDALLATQLTAPSPDVRRQAARAIRDREQTAILQAAVAKALRTESDGLVKNFLIEVAFLWAAKSPAIQASLNWLVEHEKNENLKHQAEIAIASLQQK